MDPKTTRGLLLAAGIACLAAILPWPYGFYVLLRLVVCGAAVAAALSEHPKLAGHRAAMVILGLLFNPFLPIYLTRAIWFPVDLAVGMFLLILWRRTGTET